MRAAGFLEFLLEAEKFEKEAMRVSPKARALHGGPGVNAWVLTALPWVLGASLWIGGSGNLRHDISLGAIAWICCMFLFLSLARPWTHHELPDWARFHSGSRRAILLHRWIRWAVPLTVFSLGCAVLLSVDSFILPVSILLSGYGLDYLQKDWETLLFRALLPLSLVTLANGLRAISIPNRPGRALAGDPLFALVSGAIGWSLVLFPGLPGLNSTDERPDPAWLLSYSLLLVGGTVWFRNRIRRDGLRNALARALLLGFAGMTSIQAIGFLATEFYLESAMSLLPSMALLATGMVVLWFRPTIDTRSRAGLRSHDSPARIRTTGPRRTNLHHGTPGSGIASAHLRLMVDSLRTGSLRRRLRSTVSLTWALRGLLLAWMLAALVRDGVEHVGDGYYAYQDSLRWPIFGLLLVLDHCMPAGPTLHPTSSLRMAGFERRELRLYNLRCAFLVAAFPALLVFALAFPRQGGEDGLRSFLGAKILVGLALACSVLLKTVSVASSPTTHRPMATQLQDALPWLIALVVILPPGVPISHRLMVYGLGIAALAAIRINRYLRPEEPDGLREAPAS